MTMGFNSTLTKVSWLLVLCSYLSAGGRRGSRHATRKSRSGGSSSESSSTDVSSSTDSSAVSERRRSSRRSGARGDSSSVETTSTRDRKKGVSFRSKGREADSDDSQERRPAFRRSAGGSGLYSASLPVASHAGVAAGGSTPHDSASAPMLAIQGQIEDARGKPHEKHAMFARSLCDLSVFIQNYAATSRSTRSAADDFVKECETRMKGVEKEIKKSTDGASASLDSIMSTPKWQRKFNPYKNYLTKKYSNSVKKALKSASSLFEGKGPFSDRKEITNSIKEYFKEVNDLHDRLSESKESLKGLKRQLMPAGSDVSAAHKDVQGAVRNAISHLNNVKDRYYVKLPTLAGYHESTHRKILDGRYDSIKKLLDEQRTSQAASVSEDQRAVVGHLETASSLISGITKNVTSFEGKIRGFARDYDLSNKHDRSTIVKKINDLKESFTEAHREVTDEFEKIGDLTPDVSDVSESADESEPKSRSSRKKAKPTKKSKKKSESEEDTENTGEIDTESSTEESSTEEKSSKKSKNGGRSSTKKATKPKSTKKKAKSEESTESAVDVETESTEKTSTKGKSKSGTSSTKKKASKPESTKEKSKKQTSGAKKESTKEKSTKKEKKKQASDTEEASEPSTAAKKSPKKEKTGSSKSKSGKSAKEPSKK